MPDRADEPSSTPILTGFAWAPSLALAQRAPVVHSSTDSRKDKVMIGFKFMKMHAAKWPAIALSSVLFQGCVAIPPLIQVQHKDDNEEIKRRLDAIDRRLERLEERSSEKPAGK